MKVVILAAGEGKRMRPLTERIPKSLLPVAEGKSFLERAVKAITSITSISEVLIIVNYRKELVEKKIGCSRKGKPIKYILSPLKGGLISGVRTALPYIGSEQFILLVGDIVIPKKDYQEIVKQMRKSPRVDAFIGVQYIADGNKLKKWKGGKVTIRKGYINQIKVEKDLDTGLITPGIWAIKNTAVFYNFFNKLRGNYISSVFAEMIKYGYLIKPFYFSHAWQANTPEELEEISQKIALSFKESRKKTSQDNLDSHEIMKSLFSVSNGSSVISTYMSSSFIQGGKIYKIYHARKKREEFLEFSQEEASIVLNSTSRFLGSSVTI